MRMFTLFGAFAALLTSSLTTTALAEDGDDAYDAEPVVYGQRRLVLAPGVLRPEASLYFSQLGANSDTNIGLDIAVEYAPLEKLQVGILSAPRLTPNAGVDAVSLYARYLLLDGGFQLALEGGYTFHDAGPGSLHLGVPLQYVLNDAARLVFLPFLDLNLPPSGGDLTVDLDLGVSLGISLTRAIYLDVTTGFVLPQFKSDLARVPLGLELGYSLEGNEGAAYVDFFLRARFDAFLLPSAPAGSDTLNLDAWSIGIGGRFHFALD